MEHPLNQSPWERAKEDTEKYRKDSPIWYWGFEVIGGVLFTGIGLWFTPEQPNKFESALYPGIGLIGGLILAALLVFVWNLFKAPYRQRNEFLELLLAKPIPLQNRAELISSIIKVRQTAIELIGWKAQTHNAYLDSPYLVQTDLTTKVDDCDAQLTSTLNDLEVQSSISGGVFTEIISRYSSFIKSAMMPNARDAPYVFNVLEVGREIQDKETEVIQQIDLLSGNVSSSARSVSRKEGSQKQ